MLWDVWHEWPSGAQFTFKCYHHWATLMVRDTEDGSGHFLQIKESVTQGYPPCHDRLWNSPPPPPHKGDSLGTSPRNTAVVRG